MWALVSGLPEEAATWREGKPLWTVADELAAQVVERSDFWGREIFRAVAASAGTEVFDSDLPPSPEINHPSRQAAREEKQPAKKPERDPKVIRAWFEQHMSPHK